MKNEKRTIILENGKEITRKVYSNIGKSFFVHYKSSLYNVREIEGKWYLERKSTLKDSQNDHCESILDRYLGIA